MKKHYAFFISLLMLISSVLGQGVAFADTDPSLRNDWGKILDVYGNILAEDVDGHRNYPNNEVACHIIGMEDSLHAYFPDRLSDQSIILTIDLETQKKAEATLEALTVKHENEASPASIIIMDMTGGVLAMANTNAYDPNVVNAETLPDEIMNHAIQSKYPAGQLFQTITGFAALSSGAITLDDTISDNGPFDMYSRDNPSFCWVEPDKIHLHADQSLSDAIRNACDYYFFELGVRMNPFSETLYTLCQEIMLTEKTNIELPNEAYNTIGRQESLYTPYKPLAEQESAYAQEAQEALLEITERVAPWSNVGDADERNRLFVRHLMEMSYLAVTGKEYEDWKSDIRRLYALHWGDFLEISEDAVNEIVSALLTIKWLGPQAITNAAGQGYTELTPISLATYMTMVANGGYLYEARVIDSLVSSDGFPTEEKAPVLRADLSGRYGAYLTEIRKGMACGGTSANIGRFFEAEARQTGEALYGGLIARADSANVTWFAGFFPHDEPEYVVVICAPQNDSLGNFSDAVENILKYLADR